MLHLGAHIKTKPTYTELIEDTLSLGGDTFAFFLRPPRGGKLRALSDEEINSFNKDREEKRFAPLVVHAPYVYNLASQNPSIRKKTTENLCEDVQRLAAFDNVYYNIHPGAHGGTGLTEGIKHIQNGLNQALNRTDNVVVLLETMAGKGTEVGGTFDDLARILDGIKSQNQVYVCLDTCHVFDAGCDLLDKLDDVLAQFDKTIGIKNLKALHLNDSLYGLNSKKDRHAPIGFGKLGLRGISGIVKHPFLKGLPFILETPYDSISHAEQIALVKDLFNNHYSEQEFEELEQDLHMRYPELLSITR